MEELLSIKLRPKSLKDIIGQEHLVGENKVIYNTDIPYHLVRVNNNAYNAPYDIQSNIEDAFKIPYEMYVINQNDTVSSYQKTIFNIFDDYYCGIYKFNSNVN